VTGVLLGLLAGLVLLWVGLIATLAPVRPRGASLGTAVRVLVPPATGWDRPAVERR
jgi:hypothetical protein